MIVPRYYEDLSVLHDNTMPARAYYMPASKRMDDLVEHRELSDRMQLLNGTWKFQYFDSIYDMKDAFYEDGYSVEGFDEIKVPSVWQMAGYDTHQYTNIRYPFPFDPPYVPQDIPCGAYVHTFDYAKDAAAPKAYLNFEGVDSCFYVWLNGTYVGYSQVSHMTSEFDVTDVLREGENRISVLVMKWCDGSYLEDQDKFRMSGIFRDVYLLKRPEKGIRDYRITTQLDSDIARINLTAAFYEPTEVRVKLEDKNGAVVSEGVISESGESTFEIVNYTLWNTENPYLYTIILETEQEVIVDHIALRKIEIKTRGLSNEIFAGKYHTAFRGRGMSFSEVREYRAGDDVRDIDWNVTARSRKPHIKIYEEERELTMMLLVDVSASRMFGSTDRLKKNIITEIAAVLAFSAAQNNDKVGCIFFSDKVEKFIPPKKGRSHILMIIRELVGFRPESTGTKLSEPVRFLTNVNKKRCTTFILSDFMDSSKDKAALDDALKIAGGKHDLVGIRVYDPRETELPDVGIVELKDAESGRKVWVDTSSRAVREHYARTWERRSAEIDSTLKHNRIDSTMISTDGDYVAELLKLFKQR